MRSRGLGLVGFFKRLELEQIGLMAMAVGLFIQLSGKVWIVSGGARNTQIYVWLLLPALILCVCSVIQKRRVRVSWFCLPWLFFLSWVSLSTLWASGSETSAISLAKRALFIALYFVAIYFLINKNEKLFRRALYAGVLLVALGALASLIYQYGVLGKSIGFRSYRIDRMGYGNFANYGWPVVAGILNGAVAIWALGYGLYKRQSRSQAFFWLMIFAVLAIYVVMTGTRGAWFALLGGVLASVIIQKSKLGLWGIAIGVLLLLGVSLYYWDQIVFEVAHRQLSGRGPIWIYYFNIMHEHWLLGYGLGTPFEYVWGDGKLISPHAHSLYLQQVYDSGLVSLGFMLVGLLTLTYKAWVMRHHPLVQIAFPALLFALIAMLTDVERVFTRPGDYWTIFWLPIAVLLAVPGPNFAKAQYCKNTDNG